MASEWRPHRIGGLGKVITGRTPPGTAEKYFGGDVLFLTPSDFDGGRYIERTARSLSPLGADELKRVIVERGVAVSCIGWQMGKSVLIERTTATNQQINTVVADESKVSLLFLYYSLLARRNQIFGLGSTATRTPIVNKSTFENIEILIPNLDEQHSIATILSSLDDKIELNRRMNATLGAIAQALFKSWFVDFDPVRAKAAGRAPEGMDADTAALFHSEFQDSELESIPKGWLVRELKDFVSLSARMIQPSAKPDELFAHFSIPAFDAKRLPVIEVGVGIQSGKYLVEPNSVLVSKLNPRTPRVWLPALPQERQAVCSTEFMQFIPFNQTALSYLYCLMISDYAQQAVLMTVTGTTGSRQRAQPPQVMKSRFIWAGDKLVAAFADVAVPLLERVAANLEEGQRLALVRDVLLPKLISGQLRIPEAEELAEAAL